MTDERLEQIVGRLLWWGVALSAVVVLAGGVWHLAANHAAPANYRVFRHTAWSIRSLPPPEALILAGLLLLIATPVARVAFALIAFALERDRIFVAISLVVLAVLVVGLVT